MTSSLERAIQESKEREEKEVVEKLITFLYVRTKALSDKEDDLIDEKRDLLESLIAWEPKWRKMVEWILARRKIMCWCSISAKCDWCHIISELERLAKEGLGETK